ncbi:MAG TPA: pyrroline-5-carboxylate reductase [Solirubrobacterales bacterium]|nr:pyrroline-5-carboxylate reductase [Solirubrobacterales bacterium]
MRIGFLGSGNMARAIALGLNEPALFSDSGSGRAAALAIEAGGSSASNADVVEASDLIFLCHKPAQLDDVAAQIDVSGKTVVSALAVTPLERLREAYPSARVGRIMPNTPVEFGAGVICLAAESDVSGGVRELVARLGDVIEIPESDFELATAIGGCAPAFYALFAQRLVEAAVARGMSDDLARRIAGGTLSGTARLLHATQMDTEGAMRAVASPGGLTERALRSFDESGLNETVDRAVATVLGEST